MAILHTLNKPPSNCSLSDELATALLPEDSILLIEDGVYHALETGSSMDKWLSVAKRLYILKEDALCRGLIDTPSKATLISYEQFVELSTSHKKVISWY